MVLFMCLRSIEETLGQRLLCRMVWKMNLKSSSLNIRRESSFLVLEQPSDVLLG